MQNYEDFDYGQYLHFDRETARHWTFPPVSEVAKDFAAEPPTHSVVLIPADPDYSPTEHELWPVVHSSRPRPASHNPEVQGTIQAAVRNVVDAHEAWRNPHPYIEKHKSGKRTRRSLWN